MPEATAHPAHGAGIQRFAGGKFELLGKKEPGEPLKATPALAGGLLIVRSE